MNLISKLQIQTLQIARRQVWQKSGGVFDDAQFRLALRNVGGVSADATGRVSSKGLSQVGFEQMMALLEDMGFREANRPEDHWRSRSDPNRASTRQIHEIHRLAEGGRYTVEAMCRRQTGGSCTSPQQLSAQEARSLIETFKAIATREPK